MSAEGLDDVWSDWKEAVNMSASELERWLETDESEAAGDHGSGGESTGHASGRHIVAILHAKKADLTDDDVAHMRKVVGYVRRHLAQGGKARNDPDSAWRMSLMNWGHDPLKG